MSVVPFKANSCKVGALVCVLVNLTACGPLVELPGSGPAPSLFYIAPLPASGVLADPGTDRPVIIIHEPEMPTALAVDHIAVVLRNHELRYLPDARWVEKTPRLIQFFLIESLSNLGTVDAIGTELISASSEYHLFMFMDAFQIDAQEENNIPHINVGARLRLVESATGEILDSERLDVQNDIESVETNLAIGGFEAALREFARGVNGLIVRHTRELSR